MEQDFASFEVQKKGKLVRTELVEMVYEFIDDHSSEDNNALNEAQKTSKKGPKKVKKKDKLARTTCRDVL